MKQNVIAEKSAAFAVRIINLTRYLRKSKVESVLINQLLRSGTSIAANVHEATVAISKDDFKSKMSISLKEARETSYWLKVLCDTKTISPNEYESFGNDSAELEKILFAIVKTCGKQNEK